MNNEKPQNNVKVLLYFMIYDCHQNEFDVLNNRKHLEPQAGLIPRKKSNVPHHVQAANVVIIV